MPILRQVILLTACAFPFLTSGVSDTAEINRLNKMARDFLQTNHDSASHYAETAFGLAQNISYQKGIANALITKGASLSRKGMNKEALGLFFQTLNIVEKIPDSNILATTFNWIGSAYLDQQNWELAMKYYKFFLSASEKLGDESGMGAGNNNVGTVLHETHQLEQALEYYQKANFHWEKSGNLRGVAGSLTNIGIIYGELGDYKKAFEFQERGLALSRSTGNKVFESISLSELGELYFKTKDYEKAIQVYHLALDLSNRLNYTEGRKSAYKGLVKVYQFLENYKLAYENFKALSAIKDSLFSAQSARSMAEISAQYETVKREKTISELKAHSQEQELKSFKKTVVLIFIFLALSLAFLFLFLRFKRRQKEARLKAAIEAAHNERARISRDIHDELGSGLTRLVHMAEQSQHADRSNADLTQEISSITNSATNLVSAVGDLVWSINPENGGLDYLIAKIREFAYDCEEVSGMKFQVTAPDNIPDFKLGSEAKKNIFLFAKEAIHNAVKHSGGKLVTILISFSGEEMEISISDDGIGFKGEDKAKTRHGMGNMRHRIESLSGKFFLRNAASGTGTCVAAIIPVRSIRFDGEKESS